LATKKQRTETTVLRLEDGHSVEKETQLLKYARDVMQSRACCQSDDVRRVQVGPLAIAAVTLSQVLQALDRMMSEGRPGYVCFCEVNLLAQAHLSKRVVEVLNAASITVADGICVLQLASACGSPLPERVPGPSFFLRACEYGVSRGWRHFFYGGAEGVAETLAARMRERFPGIEIAGTYSPPYRSISDLAESDEVLRQIEEARTDLLWVGLGGPKQEFWMAEHKQRLKVPVMLGVGAAFDFHTGNRPWAPAIVRRMGLEWVWRMLTGGPAMFKRNARCVTVVSGMILRAWLRRAFGRKRTA
jgi:N-acetylglucosaminyldiphosphoundecaprenol N-acetyl-beta-D-mannosaminyltransferase